MSQLTGMAESVLKDPQATEIELLKLQDKMEDASKDVRLLWLIRMIEAANYSYQFKVFDARVEQGLALIDENTPVEIKAIVFTYKGVSEQRKGEYDKAIIRLSQSVELARSSQQYFIYTYSLAELAYAKSLAEQYESALGDLQEAYRSASNLDSEFLLGLVEESYGALYGYMDNHKNSITHYQKAHNRYIELGYPFYIGETSFGIATTYRYWKKWPLALEWFKRYKKAVIQFESSYASFFYHYGIGMTYAEKGNCSNALQAISEAIMISGFKDYKAELYKRMAFCLASFKDFIGADSALAEAKIIYAEMPELKGTSWELELEKISAQIAAMNGEFEKAYKILEKYHQDYLTVQQVSSSKRIEKLELEMRRERAELELLEIDRQSQLQKLKLNNQQRKIELQQFWLYGFIIITLIIVTVVIWQLRTSRKLKSLSITDELTGLMNRRFIYNSINNLLSKESGSDTYHSLMLVDIDKLKYINDNYGHPDGDRAIKLVASSINKVIRHGDILARIGGDEFMLLLSRIDADREVAIAKRIVKEVNNNTLLTRCGVVQKMTVSLGIVAIKDFNTSIEILYSRADKALYRAKSSGRNCIMHWKPDTD